MDMLSWLPSLTTTGLLAFALWLGRNLIATRLTASVEHEFNSKLESLRADLRAKETEIAALRGGAMSALESRQIALDKRRLEAVDQLWSAVTALGPAKGISSFMVIMKFEAAAEEAAKNPNFRKIFEALGAGLDPAKMDFSQSAKARPFVSPMAWALFSAYQAIAVQAIVKLQIVKSGVGADMLDKQAATKLVKAALPHQAEYVDKYGDTGFHYLLEELEGRLLDEMQNMLKGVEADKASLDQAAEILKRSNELSESTRQSEVPPSIARNRDARYLEH